MSYTEAPATRVLYVDHRLVDLLQMQVIVGSRPGLALHLAFNSTQALAVAPSLHPSLLLIGLDLPDGSGQALLRALRRQPACAEVPAVALTADGDSDALSQGFDEVWSKPLQRRPVMNRLDRLHGPTPRSDDRVEGPTARDEWPSTLGEARACALPPLPAAPAAGRQTPVAASPFFFKTQERRR